MWGATYSGSGVEKTKWRKMSVRLKGAIARSNKQLDVSIARSA